MEDGLRGRDGDDEVGLDERRVDAQGDVAVVAEVDEVVRLGVVHEDASFEPTPEVRRNEDPDLPRRRPAREAARDQDRDLLHAEADELVGDGGSCDVHWPRVDRGDRQRRLLDHDRRCAAGLHQFRERLAREWERKRVEHRPADVLERLALPWRPQDEIVVLGVGDDETRVVQERDPGHETRRAVAAVTPRAMKMPPETQRRSFAPVPAAAQLAREQVGEQRVHRVRGEGDRREQHAQERDLRRDRAAARVDELRQEGEEEQRRLRVEHVDDHSLCVEPAVRRRRDLHLGVLLAAQDAPDADHDQVRGTDELDDGERGRRRGDQRREPDRRGGDVDEPSARDAERPRRGRRGVPCRCSA